MDTIEEKESLGLYLLDGAVKWINENMNPEDVFDHDTLKVWALNNDFKEGIFGDYEQALEYVLDVEDEF